MSARALFDTENLFRGFRAKEPASVSEERRTIQEALFGPGEDAAACDARAAVRVLDAVFRWFAEAAMEPVERLDSYGKVKDYGVESLLLGLGREQDTFARVPNRRGAPVDSVIDPQLQVAFFLRDGVRIFHHNVDDGPDVAEKELVQEFQRQLRDAGDDVAYLIGGEDHGALYPADHAVMDDPALRLWILLPAKRHFTWRQMHRLGQYPHIRPEHVVVMDELLDEERSAAQIANRKRRRGRQQQRDAIHEARVAARALAAEAWTRSAEDALARLIGIDADRLSALAFGSHEWDVACGHPWMADAVRRHLSHEARQSDLDGLRAGSLKAHRVRRLVIACGLREIRESHPGIPQAALDAFVSRLQPVFPYYRYVRPVLATVGADAGTAADSASGERNPDADPAAAR